MGKGTFLFVHGSGNRDAQAQAYGELLRKGLGLPKQSPKLRVSTWGLNTAPDTTFPEMYKVLPRALPTLGEEIAPEVTDPLLPLRLLAPPEGLAEAEAPGDRRDTDLAMGLLRGGMVDLTEIGVSFETLQAAASEVHSSADFQAATAEDAAVMDATIRSVVATAIQPAEGLQGLGLEDLGPISDAFNWGVAKVTHTIFGGAAYVLGGIANSGIGDAAKLALSKRLAAKRLEIMRANFLIAADVLAYQRCGAAMRAWVKEEIAKCEAPVVAMGHSLGGILLVDALLGPKASLAGCKLLVTFGSQAPMLMAMGAIEEVTVPKDFAWLNIWTRYDFVSFLAADIFPGATDREVTINYGFPDSHGRYYTTPEFFDAIKAHPVAAAVLA